MDGTEWTRPCPRPIRPGQPGYDKSWLPFTKTSPLHGEALNRALTNHPNADLRDFIRDMTDYGVTLGVDATRLAAPRPKVGNLPSARVPGPARRATIAWVANEVEKQRLRGPFPRPPHPALSTWPVGAIPKSRKIPIEVKARVITHFSYGQDSLNDAIDKESCTMQYMRYIQAVDAIEGFIKDGDDPWLVATDLQDAFRIVQIAPENLHLQGIHLQAEDGTDQWYYDGHLGFGTASGPRIFDSLASAIHWVLQERCDEAGIDVAVFHLLDDFLMVARSKHDAVVADRIKTAFLAEIGIPEQAEKRVAPCQRLKYLGLIICVRSRRIYVPEDKLEEMIASLQNVAAEGTILTTDLERLTGQLTFYGIAFPRLRPLVSPLYAASAMARRRGWRLAKPSRGARRDAATIAQVLRRKPATPLADFFLDPWSCDDMVATDASGSDGCGGFSIKQGYTFHSPWPQGFDLGDDDVSTCLQEMVAAALLIERAPEGSSLAVWTDSRTMKDAFGRGRSSSPAVNEMLRAILTTCALRNVHLIVTWHRRDTSLSAVVADLLSHGDFQAAEQLVPALSGTRRLEVTSDVARLCDVVCTATRREA